MYAISLSNCPKLSDNPRIKTVEYTVESNVGKYFDTGHSGKIAHSEWRFWKDSRKSIWKLDYLKNSKNTTRIR